eukprot:g73.t1
MARPVPGHEPPPFRPGQEVLAAVKMKWTKKLTQMNPKGTGSHFKVERGCVGTVASIHPLRVRWELGPGRASAAAHVGVDQIEDAASSSIARLAAGAPGVAKKKKLFGIF